MHIYDDRGKTMFTRILGCFLVHFISVLSVDGVTLSLNPPTVVIGSSTVNPTIRLNVQCSSSGTLDIDTFFQLKLSRRKFTEPNFIGIASMKFDGLAKLDPTVPCDIQNRSPNITGSVDTRQKSGTMTLSISAQGLARTDQAEFRCSFTYLNPKQSSHTFTDNKNFTVIISSGGTAGPTTKLGVNDYTHNNLTEKEHKASLGSNIYISTVVAILLGLMVGVFVLVILILSICLHRYRKLADLQSQAQSRAHTYDRRSETTQSSRPYAALNFIPSDGSIRLEENSYLDLSHNVL